MKPIRLHIPIHKTGCFIAKHPVVINNSLFCLCFLNNLYF